MRNLLAVLSLLIAGIIFNSCNYYDEQPSGIETDKKNDQPIKESSKESKENFVAGEKNKIDNSFSKQTPPRKEKDLPVRENEYIQYSNIRSCLQIDNCNLQGNNREIEKVIIRNPYLNSYISAERTLSIFLDNDLFNNTDRYYTNGVKIKFQSPAFALWRINKILPVSEKDVMEYNSLEIQHAMYTPYTTKIPPLLKDDRPYSSTLLVRFVRIAENPLKGIVQKASFDIGVIGQAALGSVLQEGVHASLPTNDEPLGWETQIGNDIILNYNYELVQRLLSAGKFHAYSLSSISAGTHITNISTGFGFKIGTDNEFLDALPESLTTSEYLTGKKFNITWKANCLTSVVGYNATLSGGLLNKSNIYVLEPHEIERLIFTAETVITISYGKYGINLAQYFITNEFKKGKKHTWGQLGINFEL